MDKIKSYVTYRDEYEYRILVPKLDPPTWRDWWNRIKGTYEPRLYLIEITRLTLIGYNRELKKHYSEPLLEELLYQENPFLGDKLQKKKPPK